MPVPRRSTEPGRPRHRAPDTVVDFHTGQHRLAQIEVLISDHIKYRQKRERHVDEIEEDCG